MENIQHSHVEVKGLKLHVAEIGTGEKVVVFLHGFPEIWYTWRHQMIAVANAGYRAIAFDFRGYGLSDHPAEPEKATLMDLVDDVKDLLDTLGISKAILIGKDFGAIPAYLVAAVHPEKVASVITLGVPFILPGPSAVQNHLLPKGFYITRWQEPGRAEADFGRFDIKSVIRNIYILFSKSEVPVAGDDQEIMDLFNPSTPLPPWFSEEDLTAYALLYEKSGFRFALQVPYRSKMENIQHSHVEVKGLKLHVAEIGTGEKAVVFLHGFPEIWYTWRYQMIAVANAGYRAIAFDSRGYGLSDHPAEPEKATIMDLVDEVKDLLDTLGINKAFLIGKDSGAIVANLVPAVYPEKVASLITLGIPFMNPGPSAIQNHLLPKGFYITRWQEPGRAEADFGRFDVKSVIRNIYILFSKTEVPVASDDQEIMDLFNPSTPLPPWFSEEDLTAYASLYEKSGFRFALQVPYRSLTVESGLIDPKVNVPALLIMGEKDYCFNFPGMEDYIRSGVVKNFVPNLETIYIPEGSHFVHEQFPEEVNKLIIEFLDKQSI